MISRRILLALITAALTLPIVATVLFAAARLLSAVQDHGGAAGVDRVALCVGIGWAVALAALVIATAINSFDACAPDEPLD